MTSHNDNHIPHTCTCIIDYICMYIVSDTHIHTHTQSHTHTYTHTHTHTCTHTHAHTHMPNIVSYPDPYVRNDDHRLQYDITYRGSGNEVVRNGSWNVVGMYIVT